MAHTHTFTRFDNDLIALRSHVTTMADLVERQFLRAVDAIRTADLSLAARVLDGESEVNRRHLATDLLCNEMLARLQNTRAAIATYIRLTSLIVFCE